MHTQILDTVSVLEHRYYLMKVKVPPIKSQGIKTKLVPWIKSIIPSDFEGRWIELFMGTGVVAFNIIPKHALMCDANPHLINFYVALKNGEGQSQSLGQENSPFLSFSLEGN